MTELRWLKGKLSKVSGGERLRSSSVTGYYFDAPEVGVPFTLYAAPVNPEALVRQVRTSYVQKILGSEIHTLNSVYRLDPA